MQKVEPRIYESDFKEERIIWRTILPYLKPLFSNYFGKEVEIREATGCCVGITIHGVW